MSEKIVMNSARNFLTRIILNRLYTDKRVGSELFIRFELTSSFRFRTVVDNTECGLSLNNFLCITNSVTKKNIYYPIIYSF